MNTNTHEHKIQFVMKYNIDVIVFIGTNYISQYNWYNLFVLNVTLCFDLGHFVLLVIQLFSLI